MDLGFMWTFGSTIATFGVFGGENIHRRAFGEVGLLISRIFFSSLYQDFSSSVTIYSVDASQVILIVALLLPLLVPYLE